MTKTREEELECDVCGNKLTEEQLAWEEDNALQPCECEEYKEYCKLRSKIKKLNKTIKELKSKLNEMK